MSTASEERTDHDRIRSNAWARHVRVQATAVCGHLEVATARTADEPLAPRDQALAATVRRHLDDVAAATSLNGGRPSRLLDWWRGTSVEQAFCSLHSARIAMVDLVSDEEVLALVPDAVARVGSCLYPTDPRRLAVEHLADEECEPERRRALLRHALEMGYAASDESHARLRAFRNVLLSAALLTAAFMVLFIAFVSVDPKAVPLCFHPAVSAAAAAQNAATHGGVAADYSDRTVCPTGEQVATAGSAAERLPNPRDVQIIACLGVLGGALASTVSIRKLSGKVTPYGIPVALALLKLPTGALTAVAGIILLGGAFVPGLSDLDSQRQILAYALVLGFAQQLVTQFIDRRASALVAEIPSRHSKVAPSPSLLPAAPGGQPDSGYRATTNGTGPAEGAGQAAVIRRSRV